MKKTAMLIALMCTSWFACKQKTTTQISSVETTDSTKSGPAAPLLFSCSEDSSVKYLLYAPGKSKESLPLILFFDPSGNAAAPTIKYKEIADKLNVIIVGSMNSRNGQTVGQSVYFGKTILKDVISKNNIDKDRIFVAGFSGGARVATRLAEMNPEIKGVIGNSAGFEKTQGYYPSFGFVGLGGSADMNMLELVNLHKYLKGSNTPHMLMMFDGIHEWAPLTEMKKAIIWLLCLTKSKNAEQYLSSMQAEISSRADSLEKQGRLLEAATEWETLVGCSKFLQKENNLAIANYERIQKLPAFAGIQKEMGTIWDRELTEQNRLLNGFGKWPFEKWTEETEALKNASQEKTQMGFMNKRILGFLSLACLSNTNKGFAQNDTAISGYFSKLYTIVDPENSEAWFQRSIHLARNKHTIEARIALATAQSKGFNDQVRVAAQPELMKAVTQQ